MNNYDHNSKTITRSPIALLALYYFYPRDLNICTARFFQYSALQRLPFTNNIIFSMCKYASISKKVQTHAVRCRRRNANGAFSLCCICRPNDALFCRHAQFASPRSSSFLLLLSTTALAMGKDGKLRAVLIGPPGAGKGTQVRPRPQRPGATEGGRVGVKEGGNGGKVFSHHRHTRIHRDTHRHTHSTSLSINLNPFSNLSVSFSLFFWLFLLDNGHCRLDHS